MSKGGNAVVGSSNKTYYSSGKGSSITRSRVFSMVSGTFDGAEIQCMHAGFRIFPNLFNAEKEKITSPPFTSSATK